MANINKFVDRRLRCGDCKEAVIGVVGFPSGKQYEGFEHNGMICQECATSRQRAFDKIIIERQNNPRRGRWV